MFALSAGPYQEYIIQIAARTSRGYGNKSDPPTPAVTDVKGAFLHPLLFLLFLNVGRLEYREGHDYESHCLVKIETRAGGGGGTTF